MGQPPTSSIRVYSWDPNSEIAAITPTDRYGIPWSYEYVTGRLAEAENLSTEERTLYYSDHSLGERTALGNFEGIYERYAYDPISNRLSTVTAGSATLQLGYDPGGNTIIYGTRLLSRDPFGRLVSVTDGGNSLARYGYDGQRRRVFKEVTTAASGRKPAPPTVSTTRFVYDTSGLLLQEQTADGSWAVDYIWCNGEPVAHIVRTPSGEITSWAVTDHLGVVRVLTNAAGKAVWRAEYEPYGADSINENPDRDKVKTTFNLRFPGQYHDAETGWSYNWHRYYDPKLGRYLEADPMEYSRFSSYGYADHNPLRIMDVLGLFGDGVRYSGNSREPLGHSDFFGFGTLDYTSMDKGWTSPLNPFSRYLHFRSRSVIERDLTFCLSECDLVQIEMLMHQGQDSFVHYDQGFRVYPPVVALVPGGTVVLLIQPGHILPFVKSPDDDIEEWYYADLWTRRWYSEFERLCCR